jgi:hypothetical protein
LYSAGREESGQANLVAARHRREPGEYVPTGVAGRPVGAARKRPPKREGVRSGSGTGRRELEEKGKGK